MIRSQESGVRNPTLSCDLIPDFCPLAIAVAISGGPDSMALLLLAHQWAQQKGGHIVALTVDHGLRSESKHETETVRKWVEARGIEQVTLRWEGEKPTSQLQEKAREARYHLLTTWCKANNISTLLLGHHLQDQTETFWMRLAAGSGLDGLACMREKSVREGVTLLRPLLKIDKEDLKGFLRAEKQEWIEDPSNEKATFFRGRLRTFLKEEGLSSERLSNTLTKLQEDADFIQQSVQLALERVIKYRGDDTIFLDKAVFTILHPAISKRVLAIVIQQFSGTPYPPRSALVEGVLKKLNSPSAFTAGSIYWTQTPEEIFLRRERGRRTS